MGRERERVEKRKKPEESLLGERKKLRWVKFYRAFSLASFCKRKSSSSWSSLRSTTFRLVSTSVQSALFYILLLFLSFFVGRSVFPSLFFFFLCSSYAATTRCLSSPCLRGFQHPSIIHYTYIYIYQQLQRGKTSYTKFTKVKYSFGETIPPTWRPSLAQRFRRNSSL